ncbi:DUF3088 family protein [Mesorhizobium sp. IMUNJ 23033]|uniref:DUF3088 family protein n=1 Tax=Mesorhizobium sp. IMUNJ 23033 TaxID=3378039 RepID=UPI0038515387
MVDLIGAENQALPVLVLAGSQQTEQAPKVANGRTFVSGSDAIIAAFAELYGIPVPHP